MPIIHIIEKRRRKNNVCDIELVERNGLNKGPNINKAKNREHYSYQDNEGVWRSAVNDSNNKTYFTNSEYTNALQELNNKYSKKPEFKIKDYELLKNSYPTYFGE